MSNDKASPSAVAKKVNAPEAKKSREAAALRKAYDDGHRQGVKDGHRELIDYLQEAYINDSGRPDRNSPKGDAILELARNASEHFRSLEDRAANKRRRS